MTKSSLTCLLCLQTLAVTYGIGAPVFLIMTIVGYWAYGNVRPWLQQHQVHAAARDV